MDQNKKYKILKRIEAFLPWLMLLPGIPAICYDSASVKEYMSFGSTEKYLHLLEMFEVFYDLSIIVGVVIIFIELIFGVTACVFLILNFFKYQKIEEHVKSNFVLWICPLFYSIGTLFLMLLVHTFTYGMGV